MSALNGNATRGDAGDYLNLDVVAQSSGIQSLCEDLFSIYHC